MLQRSSFCFRSGNVASDHYFTVRFSLLASSKESIDKLKSLAKINCLFDISQTLLEVSKGPLK